LLCCLPSVQLHPLLHAPSHSTSQPATCSAPHHPALTLPSKPAGIGLLSRAAVHYMAADPQLATANRSSSLAAAAEFRQMVAQLHEQGIEVLLQAIGGLLVWMQPCFRCPCRWEHSTLARGGCLCTFLTQPPRISAQLSLSLPHHPCICKTCQQVDLTFTAEGTDAHPSSLSLRGLDYGSYYRKNGVSRACTAGRAQQAWHVQGVRQTWQAGPPRQHGMYLPAVWLQHP